MTPDEYTNQEFFLDVGDGHQLYVHDWGNKASKRPILFLHGGPGSSAQDKHKAKFDPRKQRVIFYDQRGCGKSTPYGSLEHNTTNDLIEDIEKLLRRLELHSVIITGGSWGSCLALSYALKYPERVKAMALFGILTGSQWEVDWIDKGRFQTYFPEVWAAYLAQTPPEHHDNPTAYHYRRILGGDEQAAKASAFAYNNLEAGAIELDDRFVPDKFDEFDPSGTRMEAHYLANACFLPDRHALQNADTLTMPVWLVQGRYDMVCPPVTAYELSEALPDGHLVMTIEGHKLGHEGSTILKTILQQLTEES